MDIDDLRSSWQESGGKSVSLEQVKMMTKVRQHPTLKKIRFKLLFEALFLTVLLFVYYDGFDGDKKPFYINLVLVLSIAIYIANNVLGYFFIRNPVKAESIVESVRSQISILKKLSVFSLISSAFYAGALLIFFTSTIEFTNTKYLMVASIITFTIVMFYFSMKNWKARIQHFQKLLDEFN